MPELKTTTIRAATILTTSYVVSATRAVGNKTQLMLLCSFTKGSSDGFQLKVEFSEDNSTWYQETDQSLANSVLTHTVIEHTLVETANYVLCIPILTTFYRVSAKAITDETDTSLSIIEVVGII